MTTNFAFLIIWTLVSWIAAYLIGQRLGRVSARLSPGKTTQRRLSDKESAKLQHLVFVLKRDNVRLQRDNVRLEQELQRIER
jgi:predicted CDP-diglyceride synthetase/phosphatidate cytidylyltransferase